NELMTRNSPPKLGGEPARTKSEQAGWFPCRYWQLREPPRPRLRSGTPPNLGGVCPHSNSFTAPMTADNTAICEIAGGHRPPLQWSYSTFCAKPRGGEYSFARTVILDNLFVRAIASRSGGFLMRFKCFLAAAFGLITMIVSVG